MYVYVHVLKRVLISLCLCCFVKLSETLNYVHSVSLFLTGTCKFCIKEQRHVPFNRYTCVPAAGVVIPISVLTMIA